MPLLSKMFNHIIGAPNYNSTAKAKKAHKRLSYCSERLVIKENKPHLALYFFEWTFLVHRENALIYMHILLQSANVLLANFLNSCFNN